MAVAVLLRSSRCDASKSGVLAALGPEESVVVQDRATARAVGDGRVGRAAQVDDEGLVRLGDSVAVDEDSDGLAGLAWSEGQRAARGLVVAAGGSCAVAGGVADGDRLGAGGGQ